MPFHYINELLGLPELQLHSVRSHNAIEVQLENSQLGHKQPCPICNS